MAYSMPGKKRALGGGGSAPAAPGAPAAGSTAPAGQAASPGYVNFSRLLSVNQGGAQRMADSLASNAQQKGQAATSEIKSAKTGFEGKVAAGTQKFTAPGLAGTTSKDIYATAGQLGAQSKVGYTGPKDWAGAGVDTVKLAGNAKDAAETAKGLTTAGGRGAQLRQQAGGPYSAGMSALDAGLSGAALGSRGRDLASLYGGLSQQLIDYQTQGGALVDSATTASNEAAQQAAAEAERYQKLGDATKQTEEDAARYEAEYRRRYPGFRPPRQISVDGRPVDPRLLTPGLYG